MRRLRIAILAITLPGHLVFAAGLAHVLGRLGVPFAGWIALAAAAVLALRIRGRLRRLRADEPMAALRVRLVEEPYYAHWCATLLCMPFLLVAGPAAAISGAGAGVAALGAYGAALAVCFYGVIIRTRWVRVRTVDVPVAGLGPAFDGYRIAHLSDLHIGSLCPRPRADGWARRANALDADLVALTGDYVTHGSAFHEEIAAVLSSLRARDGVVAVLGNHDYFGDVEALSEMLRAGGVTLLRNARTTLRRGDDAVVMAGIDDRWARRADVARALDGRDAALPLLALAHDPGLFPDLARAGAALVLSGHTHWGQVAVPFAAERWNLTALAHRYHAGFYRQAGAILYVSPGLGTTGPPLRLGAPPEITVLRLRAAP